MTVRSRVWTAIAAAFAAGGAAGGFFLRLGLADNNQGEFFDPVTHRPVWDSVLPLFALPFGLVFAPALAFGLALALSGRPGPRGPSEP